MKMKKLLFITPLLLLTVLFSFGQEVTKKTNPKFFIAFSGGTAVPVGAFASFKTDSASDAGLAKVGYNFNLHAGYNVSETFGIASTIFYSKFQLNQDAVKKILSSGSSSISNAAANHWQYWGIVAGPMGTVKLSDDIFMDFKLMGGYGRANMPVLRFEVDGLPKTNVVTPERWSDAFAWQLGTDLRYNFSPNACFFTNLDYNYMRPKWSFNLNSETINLEQKMGVLDINLGLGLTF